MMSRFIVQLITCVQELVKVEKCALCYIMAIPFTPLVLAILMALRLTVSARVGQ